MEGLIVLIYVLAAIISLIVLICFFVLVSNVSAIRNTFRINHEDFGPSFNLYLAIGDKKAARDILLDRIKQDECFREAFFYQANVAEPARCRLIDKYGKQMELVDLTIDFNEVNKYIEYVYGKY